MAPCKLLKVNRSRMFMTQLPIVPDHPRLDPVHQVICKAKKFLQCEDIIPVNKYVGGTFNQ